MAQIPSLAAKHKLLVDFCGAMLQDGLWKISHEQGGGLFSANFYSRCGPFAPCNNCLCGNYYEPSDLLDSPRQTPVDDDGVNQWLVGDELRFLEGRNGDNLITVFQCDLCHF